MHIGVINGYEKYQHSSCQGLIHSNYDFKLWKSLDNFKFKDYNEYDLVIEHSIEKNQEMFLLKDRKRTNLSKYGNLGTKRLVAKVTKCCYRKQMP